MKQFALILAAAMAVALLMTGCFGMTEPAPTATPTVNPTEVAPVPTATDAIAPTDTVDATAEPNVSGNPSVSADPNATIDPEVTDGLKVAPSPSATTNP